MTDKLITSMKLTIRAIVGFDPEFILSAINPRDLADLEPEELLPKIEKTNGVITNPIMAWKAPPDHPIWDSVRSILTNEPVKVSLEERKKYLICVRGHRRSYCVCHILANTDKYSADMVKNASKVPVREVTCSQEEAEDLAMDFEESRGLHSWNLLKIVFGLFARDYTYQEISQKMPKELFEAFLTKGKAKYDALIRDPRFADGGERREKIGKMLKNPLDTNFQSLYLFGPTMVEQGLKYQRYHVDKIEDKSEGMSESLSVYAQWTYENVRKLRSIFSENKRAKKPWPSVTNIGVAAKVPTGKHVSERDGGKDHAFTRGQKLFVVGGTEEFRETVLDFMEEKYSTERRDVKDKPPTPKEKVAMSEATTSGLGTALCAWHTTKAKNEVEGEYLKVRKSRGGWEGWALSAEAIQARLLELTDMCPLVVEMIKALTSSTDPNVDAEKVVTAVTAVNNALKPVKAGK